MSRSRSTRGAAPRRQTTRVAFCTALAALAAAAALAAVGDVAGRLVGPAGEALTGYVVQLIGEEGPVAESRATDASGRFIMENVPPGRYEFRLLTRDRRPCNASIAPAIMPEAGSLEIDVRLTVLPACGAAGTDPVEPVPDAPARAVGRASRGKLGTWLGIGGGVALLLAAAGGGGDDPPPPVSPSSP